MSSFSASDLGITRSRTTSAPTDADALIRAIFDHAAAYVVHAADDSHTGGSLAKISNAITRYGRALEPLGIVGDDLATDGGPLEFDSADAYVAAVNAARDSRVADDAAIVAAVDSLPTPTE